MMRKAFVPLVFTLAALSVPGADPAQAQTVARTTRSPLPESAVTPPLGDPRWAPWIGCWRSVDDPAGSGARLCVTPTEAGVATVTLVADNVLLEDVRTADGRPHPVADGECTGTETGRWSTLALRLYRTATVSCAGEVPRTRATASFFLNGGVWVDVETVTAAGQQTSVRVARFERAHDQRLADGTVVAPPKVAPPANLPRTSAWSVDDVLELSAALPADGVQAAITEAPVPFRLNAKVLTRLADAGVGEGVIDLMIGVSYPHKFVVDRLVAGGRTMSGGGGGFGVDPFFGGPMIGMAGMMNCLAPLGWATSAYWNSCGAYGNMYGNYYYGNGLFDPWNAGWVNLSGGGSGGSVSITPPAEGRVVNGRGYTQVRPVEAVPYVGGSGDSYSGTSSNGGNSSGSSGSSGVSSSGGYSGGGMGGGGGDRMAVPRPPGGF